MTPKRYRKKPVVVEAMLFDGQNSDELFEWLQKGFNWHPKTKTITIPTLEGTMIANAGDYIIKGIKGEFYPCKPDIFETTYELIS